MNRICIAQRGLLSTTIVLSVTSMSAVATLSQEDMRFRPL